MPACPSCGGAERENVLSFDRLPSDPLQTHATSASAQQATTTEFSLSLCRDCGTLARATEVTTEAVRKRHPGSEPADNSAMRYASALGQTLSRRFDLDGRDTIELDATDERLLRDLARRHKKAHCVGFRHAPDNPPAQQAALDNLCFVNDAFSPLRYEGCRGDLVICRTTLELDNAPRALLSDLRHALKPGGRYYIEVRDSVDQLVPEGAWSLRADRTTYFNEDTLTDLLRSAGLAPTRTYRADCGRRLCVEGTSGAPEARRITRPAIDAFRRQIADFVEDLRTQTLLWNDILAFHLAEGSRAAIWGANIGSINFLNAIADARGIEFVVDLDDRLADRFVAGTGQRIVTPAMLPGLGVDTVILVGQQPHSEAKAYARDLGLSCELVVA